MERQNTMLESRIRFFIQDLIDAYEKSWRDEIYLVRKEELQKKHSES